MSSFGEMRDVVEETDSEDVEEMDEVESERCRRVGLDATRTLTSMLISGVRDLEFSLRGRELNLRRK